MLADSISKLALATVAIALKSVLLFTPVYQPDCSSDPWRFICRPNSTISKYDALLPSVNL